MTVPTGARRYNKPVVYEGGGTELISRSEISERYAQSLGARAAWIQPGSSPVAALVALGVLSARDTLVVPASYDGTAPLAQRMPARVLTAPDATAEACTACLDAAGESAHVEEPVPSIAADGCSYASGSGSVAGESACFWYVPALTPDLRVADVLALAQAADAHGAILIVDITGITPYACQPLACGAALTAEVLPGGFVAFAVGHGATGRGRRRRERPGAQRAYLLLAQRLGATAPVDTALDELAHTLSARGPLMQACMDHARVIAEYLTCHYAVRSVLYPGLAAHPDHERATRELQHGFGRRIRFALPTADDTAFFLAAPQLRPYRAGALDYAGGFSTSIEADPVDSRFVTLVAGIDDPLAIVDSLDQALRLFCNPPEP